MFAQNCCHNELKSFVFQSNKKGPRAACDPQVTLWPCLLYKKDKSTEFLKCLVVNWIELAMFWV